MVAHCAQHLQQVEPEDLIKFGFTEDQIMVGGLVVKTTLSQQAQQSAVDAVNKQALTNFSKIFGEHGSYKIASSVETKNATIEERKNFPQ